MKYLFIELRICEGEREHNHYCLYSTDGRNLGFQALRYAMGYWGFPDRERGEDSWWFHGEIVCKLVRYTELTELEYRVVKGLMHPFYERPKIYEY